MKRQTSISHGRYETPDALRHDAHTLAADVRALIEATANATDEKVGEARQRLMSALETGKEVFEDLREHVIVGARTADRVVHQHPYPTIIAAFGVGAMIGFLCRRRQG